MYGGVSQDMPDEVWRCVIKPSRTKTLKAKWKKIIAGGYKPASRVGHTMCNYGNYIYIYGGRLIEEIYEKKNEILVYDIISNTFNTFAFSPCELPPWRRNHIGELIGKTMIIFGGIDESSGEGQGKVLNDFWVLNMPKCKWYQIHPAGYKIPPLHSMSSCLALSSKNQLAEDMAYNKFPTLPEHAKRKNLKFEGVFIFGGCNAKGKCTNNLYLVKISKSSPVVKFNLNGKPPTPRCQSTINFYEKLNYLIVFGGKNDSAKDIGYYNEFYIADLELMQWVLMQTDFKVPPRADHWSQIIDDTLIIFGGTNGNLFHKADILTVNLNLYLNPPHLQSKKKNLSTGQLSFDRASEKDLRLREEDKFLATWDDKEKGICNQYYTTFLKKSSSLKDKLSLLKKKCEVQSEDFNFYSN